MSYQKMMKWHRKHPKGIKQMYMGFDTSAPGGKIRHSMAFMDCYFEHQAECRAVKIKPPTMDEYYLNERHYNEILRQHTTKQLELFETVSEQTS